MYEIGNIIVLILLVLCSVSDIKRKGVYTWVLVVMSGLLAIYLLCNISLWNWALAGGLLIGGVFLLISLLSREAIGYADSWLILLLGGYMGIKRQLLLLVIAFLIAGIVGLVGIVMKRMDKKTEVAFIPFLTVAFIGVILI